MVLNFSQKVWRFAPHVLAEMGHVVAVPLTKFHYVLVTLRKEAPLSERGLWGNLPKSSHPEENVPICL